MIFNHHFLRRKNFKIKFTEIKVIQEKKKTLNKNSRRNSKWFKKIISRDIDAMAEPPRNEY